MKTHVRKTQEFFLRRILLSVASFKRCWKIGPSCICCDNSDGAVVAQPRRLQWLGHFQPSGMFSSSHSFLLLVQILENLEKVSFWVILPISQVALSVPYQVPSRSNWPAKNSSSSSISLHSYFQGSVISGVYSYLKLINSSVKI